MGNTTTASSEIQLVAYTPLPYPRLAYIVVGTLGMFVWDILMHIPTEYELLLKQRIRLTTIIYFWARLNALFVLVSYALLFTTPLNNYCSIITRLMFFAVPPLISTPCFLFFLRVRAFYQGVKSMELGFLSGLLVVVGTSMVAPFTGAGEQIHPGSPYCTVIMKRKDLVGAAIIAPLLYNLFTFLAISVKLASQAVVEPSPSSDLYRFSNLRSFLRGKGLLGLSKTVWQDGQKYLLVFIVTTMVMFMGMLYAQRLFGLPDCAFGAPHVALENSMSSYLIRSIRRSALRADLNVPTTFNLRTRTSVTLETRDDRQQLGSHVG